MFDSGGSSGQLRDELGVLPPGDVLKCALALARNEARGAARAAGAPADARARAARRPHRRQPAAVDDGALQRRFPRRRRRPARAARLPRPRLAGQRASRRRSAPSTATARARAAKSKSTRASRRGRLVTPHLARAAGRRFIRRWRTRSREFDAVIIGPGSFYTSLMPIFLVRGVRRGAGAGEGPGHPRREPADRRARDGRASPPPTPSRGSRRRSSARSTS